MSSKGNRGLSRKEDCVDVSLQGLEKYVKKFIVSRVTASSHSNGNTRKVKQKKTNKLENKYEKKNKPVNISSDKLSRLNTKRLGHGSETEISREKPNLF